MVLHSLVPERLQRLVQRDYSETPATLQVRRGRVVGVHDGRAAAVFPLAEDTLEVARDAFEHDGGDGDERTILHARR